MMEIQKNEIDTINSFGEEWIKFDQSKENKKKLYKIFKIYFTIFPWNKISKKSVGFDMGCGSGRWAEFVAPKVGILHCIEPSKSINVAKKKLKKFKNIVFHCKTVNKIKLKNSSQDFGYSLGVLHHILDVQSAMNCCTKLLKPGAPFLIYIYYALENRSVLYKALWKISDLLRKFICLFSEKYKLFFTDFIAALIYFPIARMLKLFNYFSLQTAKFPLSFYKDKSFYMMRTDARDRFGTIIEKRFKKIQIHQMMRSAGLVNIKFYNSTPYWCAVGYKSY